MDLNINAGRSSLTQGGRRFFALRGEEVCWDECLDGEMREDEGYYICAGVLLIVEDRIAKVFFFSRCFLVCGRLCSTFCLRRVLIL